MLNVCVLCTYVSGEPTVKKNFTLFAQAHANAHRIFIIKRNFVCSNKFCINLNKFHGGGSRNSVYCKYFDFVRKTADKIVNHSRTTIDRQLNSSLSLTPLSLTLPFLLLMPALYAIWLL